jgi:hypothetical protein
MVQSMVQDIGKFINDHPDFVRWAIGILVSVALAAIGIAREVRKEKRKLKAYYEIIWKKSSALEPRDMLDIRADPKYGFRPYYHTRPHDHALTERIRRGQNVPILGAPLAGKTRAVYQALKGLKKPCDVIVPRVQDVNLEDFRIPRHWRFWRKRVLVLNDLDKFVEKQNFAHLLGEFTKNRIPIIATCRLGPEFKKTCAKLERELPLFAEPIEIAPISAEEGQ